jgi:hypothetical protein
MENLAFITTYLNSCASGKLPMADCGPAWQMLVIVVLLLLAVSTLVALRLRSGTQAQPG